MDRPPKSSGLPNSFPIASAASTPTLNDLRPASSLGGHAASLPVLNGPALSPTLNDLLPVVALSGHAASTPTLNDLRPVAYAQQHTPPLNDLRPAEDVSIESLPVFTNLRTGGAGEYSPEARRLPGVIQNLVDLKHRQYNRRAYFSRLTYYVTRTVAGLAAGLLPFVLKSSPTLAIGLSMSIIVAIVVDSTYKPGDKWRTYSRASDLLLITQLQAEGLYEQAKEILNVIQATEAEAVSQLVDLEQVLQKVKKAGS